MEISLNKRQRIAWRIKEHFKDCPELLTYHDIKDALKESEELTDYFLVDKNYKNLFLTDALPKDLYNILDNLVLDLDAADRRRIALFHGIVQFPQVVQVFNKEDYVSAIQDTIFNADNPERNELSYIFMNALVSTISDDDKIISECRKNLKMISDIMEEGYEEDSLYSQYMRLNNDAVKIPKVLTHSISEGKKLKINKLSALKLLFDFNNEDFQDSKWVGGPKEFGFTEYLSLRKRKIYNQIKMLRGESFHNVLKILD